MAKVAAVILLVILLLATTAKAAQIVFTWTTCIPGSASCPDFGHVWLCYGTTTRNSSTPPANYTACIDAGQAPQTGQMSISVDNLTPGVTVYASVYSCDNLASPNCSTFGTEYSTLPVSFGPVSTTSSVRLGGGAKLSGGAGVQ